MTQAQPRTASLHRSVTTILVRTRSGEQSWEICTPHPNIPDEIQFGRDSIEDFSNEEQKLIDQLLVDRERVFPAAINSQLYVVIEQEFQAKDSGDDWPENTKQVTERICRKLIPKIEAAMEAENILCGVVADRNFTFCGRPTLLVALSPFSSNAKKVGEVLNIVLSFAYPHQPH